MCIPKLNPLTGLMEASLLVENKDEEEELHNSTIEYELLTVLFRFLSCLQEFPGCVIRFDMTEF